jgi:predicted phosphohydrolase
MRLAVTADLHWGHGARGDAATRELARHLGGLAVDAFLIAGDVGDGQQFGECLKQFSEVSGARLVLPGNHDLWVRGPDASSWERYERRLAEIAVRHGFQYLDQTPYVAADGREAVIGSVNWYDYSFADQGLKARFPQVEAMYAEKRFPAALHNDGYFVRLGMTDAEFTGLLVSRFEAQLEALPASVERIVVAQHHPPVRELFYPTPVSTVDQRFWLAYTGNRRMQDAVLADPRVRWVLCGHTHAFCAAEVGGRQCRNIGGDYGWKRLLLVDTETGEETWWDFGKERQDGPE